MNGSFIHQSGDRSLTVQVVVVTGEDIEGVNRTVVLVNMALFWDQQEVSESYLLI